MAQIDITDDGFLSLMSDDGSTKDDVKTPSNEVGEKINKMFNDDGKDVSKYMSTYTASLGIAIDSLKQTSSSSLPWARRSPSMPRRPRRVRGMCFESALREIRSEGGRDTICAVLRRSRRWHWGCYSHSTRG